MRTERILIKPSHDNYRAVKRVCRMAKAVYNQSLFCKLINADVNGALNIIRKVIGDRFIEAVTNRGCVFHPVSWKPAY